ncbi:PREDICTED: uncharacterized protein LOC105509416 [Colobus angolensis palliatus]|uniref:uncharacterized protein LOC105509416 n=1 Tax=Colobus angolensis palliatus TaxID=336983 RepID=UPI0005F3E9B7|nr:PREDICTED: uncharacterized protein LOC105509416 [Colobus angolensis palliatus]
MHHQLSPLFPLTAPAQWGWEETPCQVPSLNPRFAWAAGTEVHKGPKSDRGSYQKAGDDFLPGSKPGQEERHREACVPSRTRLASVATRGAHQGRPRVREAGPALRRSLVQVAAGAAGLGSRMQHTRRRLAVEARAGHWDAGVQFNHEGARDGGRGSCFSVRVRTPRPRAPPRPPPRLCLGFFLSLLFCVRPDSAPETSHPAASDCQRPRTPRGRDTRETLSLGEDTQSSSSSRDVSKSTSNPSDLDLKWICSEASWPTPPTTPEKMLLHSEDARASRHPRCKSGSSARTQQGSLLSGGFVSCGR